MQSKSKNLYEKFSLSRVRFIRLFDRAVRERETERKRERIQIPDKIFNYFKLMKWN